MSNIIRFGIDLAKNSCAICRVKRPNFSSDRCLDIGEGVKISLKKAIKLSERWGSAHCSGRLIIDL